MLVSCYHKVGGEISQIKAHREEKRTMEMDRFLRKNLPRCGGISHQYIWHPVSGPPGLQFINPDAGHVLLKPLELQHQHYLQGQRFGAGEGRGLHHGMPFEPTPS